MCVNKLNDCISFVRLCESSDGKQREMLRNSEMEETETIETDMDLSQDKFPECKLFETDSSHVFMGLNENNEEIKPSEEDLKDMKRKEKQQCSTCGKVMSSR